MKYFLAFAFSLILGLPSWGQRKLPVLRATSSKLSIREGGSFYPDVWNISPKDRPDVFTANPFTGKQRFVFYSDRDSLAVLLRPGRTYDFVVLALPTLKLGAYELYQLPVAINDVDPAGAAVTENISSDVLRRFNWVLDFKNQRSYCKPNKLLYSPIPERPASK